MDSKPKPNKVTELPTGKYDAVRTLRHLLAQAERGDFNQVIVVCNRRIEPAEEADGSDEIWCTWSDMRRDNICWLINWLFAFIQRRYFGGIGLVDEDDSA